ncbi:hypothetical protein [Flavobacterium ovatum]|uniref:hypothetical protein n=1 Tax=Flavobacterium ovatum TaxID=1928857 RepID=UPI00344B5CD9
MVINILNIPNYYTSYYLLGLSLKYKIRFKQEEQFIKFNNKPLLIFTVKGKIGVIDNDDPSSVVNELYELSSLYFVTNKLRDNQSYNQCKVKSLFPHYPVNILFLYLKTFGVNLFRYLKFKDLIREIYIYIRRPFYKNQIKIKVKDNYVFFSARLWKKEIEANRIRSEFIKFCKNEDRIKFEGGFMPRVDGDSLGFEKDINGKRYSARKFSKRSSCSKLVLNNPAVGGAVSWRLAEYLNQGLFVLSFPFNIELPEDFVNKKNIHFIESTNQYKSVFDLIIENSTYHEKVSSNGKKYFDEFCAPEKQAQYIVTSILGIE